MIDAHRIIRGLMVFLFAYISLVPFYYLRPFQLTTGLPPFFLLKFLPAILIVAMAAISAWHIHRFACPFRGTRVDLFIGAYVGVALLSLVQAPYPLIGLVKCIYYTLTGILLVYLLVNHLLTWNALKGTVQNLCLICGVSALYGLFCHLTGKDYFWEDVQTRFNPYYYGNWRATGSFGNPIFFGSYLALCFPFSLWIVLQQVTRKRLILFGILSGCILMALLLTHSRGAWLAAGVSVMVMVGHVLKQRWKGFRSDLRWAIVLVFLMAVPVVIGLFAHAGLLRVFEGQLIDMENRLALLSMLKQVEQFRLAQYGTTLEILREHPLLGIGFGNFTRVFQVYKDPATPSSSYEISTTTENMYLMFSAETGLIGLAIALLAFGAIFWHIYKNYRTASGCGHQSLALTALASFSGFLVNLATWDALNEPVVRMTFWILIGLGLAVGRLREHL